MFEKLTFAPTPSDQVAQTLLDASLIESREAVLRIEELRPRLLATLLHFSPPAFRTTRFFLHAQNQP